MTTKAKRVEGLGISAIRAKIAALEAEVEGKEAAIEAAHFDREVALAAATKRIEAAFQAQEGLLAKQQEILADAKQKRQNAEQLEMAAQSQRRFAESLEAAAKTMDLGDQAIADAKLDGLRERERWSQRLADIQDGRTRRKLAELDKLRNRLARKEAEAAPRLYGTDRMRAEENARRDKEAEAGQGRSYTLGRG
jgi:hypothetical protein